MAAVRHGQLLALGALVALIGQGQAASAAERMPGSRPAIGERASDNVAPPELEGVDIVEKLGDRLPLEAMVRDEHGKPIRLGALFGDGLPVIVTFNYSSCPMLCNVMLGGFTRTLTELDWTAGQQFRIVTVSLDPRESAAQAAETRRGYLERYGRETGDGWRFVTAAPATVRAVADAAGFGYRIVPETGEVLHPAALILVSSEGVISRYLYGVEFDRSELREALVTTGLGQLTESTSKFLHACFSYEARQGFAAIAMKVMRYGGLVFVVGLVGVFATTRLVRSARAPKTGHAGSH
jgi:protein SCO1